MEEAFYLPTSDSSVFTGTEATGGPWDPNLQHGGPPSAMLARISELTPASWPGTVVRVAVEILGPVPVGEVAVTAEVVRTGRSVELIESELVAGGRPAARGRAWRIRTAKLDLPDTVPGPGPAPSMPDAEEPAPWGAPFLHQMEMRLVSGAWHEPGAAACWMRQRIPLVAGEETSGLQRLMAVADCGNGLSNVLPFEGWTFINPDLTVHLERYPQGEWICLEAATTIDPGGFGLARSTLYDNRGSVARGAQSLFVGQR
ncbi:MAG TPA: thioesterase family protein [Mycobacteriales bacterium]|nr:thioesterase family protein [Mycobacteriales bacterium]